MLSIEGLYGYGATGLRSPIFKGCRQRKCVTYVFLPGTLTHIESRIQHGSQVVPEHTDDH